jgi:hypothetical protein
MDDRVPGTGQVLRMATEGGARTTPYGSEIGTLEVGKSADIVMIDWKQVSFPYLDVETPVLDAVLLRAKTQGVSTVMIEGEVVYADGRFTRIDRDAALEALAESLKRDFTPEERERRTMSHRVMPYVKAFYDGYIDAQEHVPHYRPSSRV